MGRIILWGEVTRSSLLGVKGLILRLISLES